MTEIEALLSVDRGETPPGTVAFFLDDGTRGFRHAHAMFAAAAVLAAAGAGFAGWGRAPVALLLLLAASLALRAIPTLPEDENRDPKRQVLVVTSAGLIVRDADGLRSWRFEELREVVASASVDDPHPYLNLIDASGQRHTVDCSAYRRGERVRRVVAARLQVRRGNPG